jgi:hypothetical protein
MLETRSWIDRTNIELRVGVVHRQHVAVFDAKHAGQPFLDRDLEGIALHLRNGAATLYELVCAFVERIMWFLSGL